MPIINVSAPNVTIKRLETASSNSGTVNIGSSSTLIRAANSDRTVLYIVNTGNEWVTVDHRNDPTYGNGILLSPNGGTYQVESGNLDKRLIHGICAANKSTSVSWYEGTGEETTQT